MPPEYTEPVEESKRAVKSRWPGKPYLVARKKACSKIGTLAARVLIEFQFEAVLGKLSYGILEWETCPWSSGPFAAKP